MTNWNNYEVEGQLTIFDLDPDLWCLKTSPEPLVQTEAKISDASSKKPQKWPKGMPAYLDLTGGGGHTADVSWEPGGALLGVYTMRSFGEYPSEERESRLSQILEVNAHQKYYLSPKACLGILRRAKKRGKKLPEILEAALNNQAKDLLEELDKESEKTNDLISDTIKKLSVSKNEPENPGGGKGILIQKERTGALSTLNNQSVLCKETIGSLCARDYKGVGEQYVNEGKVIIQHGKCDMPE